MKNKDILTTHEVADLLDLPLVTIQRWEHQGKIPSKLIKHKKCFNRREILQWAVEHDFIVRTKIETHDNISEQILGPAIKRAGIYHDVTGEDIVEVFENVIYQLPFLENADRNLILNEMLNREELASTGIGNGIAIPHTRERLQLGLDEIYIPIIFLKDQIEFNAIDGNPVFTLFIIFTSNTRDHLTVLSRISQALKNESLLDLLNDKSEEQRFIKQIIKIEQDFRK